MCNEQEKQEEKDHIRNARKINGYYGWVTKKTTPAKAILEAGEAAPPPRKEALDADSLTNKPMPTKPRIHKWKRVIVIHM